MATKMEMSVPSHSTFVEKSSKETLMSIRAYYSARMLCDNKNNLQKYRTKLNSSEKPNLSNTLATLLQIYLWCSVIYSRYGSH